MAGRLRTCPGTCTAPSRDVRLLSTPTETDTEISHSSHPLTYTQGQSTTEVSSEGFVLGLTVYYLGFSSFYKTIILSPLIAS